MTCYSLLSTLNFLSLCPLCLTFPSSSYESDPDSLKSPFYLRTEPYLYGSPVFLWESLILTCPAPIVIIDLSFPEKPRLLEGSPVPSSTLYGRVQVHLPSVDEEAPYKDGSRVASSQGGSSLGGKGNTANSVTDVGGSLPGSNPTIVTWTISPMLC